MPQEYDTKPPKLSKFLPFFSSAGFILPTGFPHSTIRPPPVRINPRFDPAPREIARDSDRADASFNGFPPPENQYSV